MKKIEAPIHGTWPVVERWLTSLGPGAAPLVSAAAWSPVFSNQGFPPGDELLTELWTTGGDVSWLGGPAVAGLGSWPRNADGDALAVHGAAIEVIGDLAARNAIALHELSQRQASLEEAYLKLTDDAVDYRAAQT